MAVIQDLPPELLRRVLELLRDDSYTGSFVDNLGRTSLVARAWRHPSQALRVYHMNPDRPSPAVLRANAGCTLRHVVLDSSNARARLKVLEDHRIFVETLELYDTRARAIDVGDMSLQLFARLKSLNIRGSFAGHPTVPVDTNLELTHLELDSRSLPSLSFLDSIPSSAPFLTSLALDVKDNGDLFPAEYSPCLDTIAQQLRRLEVHTDVSWRAPTSRPSPAVTRFVASCTSLRSLELHACSTAYLNDVSAATRAPLAVLETTLAHGWNKGGTGVAELAAVLELPEMANLRRWRMENYDHWGCVLSENERALWEAACRARGVEPRNERRFFNDYPAT